QGAREARRVEDEPGRRHPHAAAVPVSAARGVLGQREHGRSGELRMQVSGDSHALKASHENAKARNRHLMLFRVFVFSWLSCVWVASGAGVALGSRAAFDAANDAWRRGDFIAALNGYIQILNGPDADDFLPPIALTTGELFVTHELTTD